MSCRFAIEDTMRKFPDADHVYIMCDGDVAPFFVQRKFRTIDDSMFKDISRPQYCSDEAKKDQVEWKVPHSLCLHYFDADKLSGIFATT